MTMFWGVSSSDVCEWDTKLSATDPERSHRALGGGSADPSGRAGARGASEPSLQLLGWRLRPTRDRGSRRDDVARQPERDRTGGSSTNVR